MKERLHTLDTVLEDLASEEVVYISDLARDCTRLVDEISVALGRNIPDAVLLGSDSARSET
jgi:hypothetical protein